MFFLLLTLRSSTRRLPLARAETWIMPFISNRISSLFKTLNPKSPRTSLTMPCSSASVVGPLRCSSSTITVERGWGFQVLTVILTTSPTPQVLWVSALFLSV